MSIRDNPTRHPNTLSIAWAAGIFEELLYSTLGHRTRCVEEAETLATSGTIGRFKA